MQKHILICSLFLFFLYGCNLKTSEESSPAVETTIDETIVLPQIEQEETSIREEEPESQPEVVSETSFLIVPQVIPENVELSVALNLDSADVHTIATGSYEVPSRWLNAWYSSNTYFVNEDTSTYNFKHDMEYVDQSGNKHEVQIYFRKIQVVRYALNTYWQLLTFIDGKLQTPFHQDAELIDAVNTNAAVLQFDASGQLTSTISARQFSEDSLVRFRIENNDTTGDFHLLTLNFEDTTQYGAEHENYIKSQFSYPRIPPAATQNVKLGVNLDADVLALPLDEQFSSLNPATFHHITALTIYDSLGEPHSLTIYFRKLSEKMGENAWALFFKFDGVYVEALGKLHSLLENEVPSDITPVVLSFARDGSFADIFNDGISETDAKLEMIVVDNGASPLNITVEFASTTQYGSEFNIYNIEQDGHTVLRHEILNK